MSLKGLPFRTKLSIVWILMAAMYILVIEFWGWGFDSVIVLGILPWSYFWYVIYGILSILVLGFIIWFAWPEPPADIFDEEISSSSIMGGGK